MQLYVVIFTAIEIGVYFSGVLLYKSYFIENALVNLQKHAEDIYVYAYAKIKAQISFAVTAKLISTFVFPTQIVQ